MGKSEDAVIVKCFSNDKVKLLVIRVYEILNCWLLQKFFTEMISQNPQHYYHFEMIEFHQIERVTGTCRVQEFITPCRGIDISVIRNWCFLWEGAEHCHLVPSVSQFLQ